MKPRSIGRLLSDGPSPAAPPGWHSLQLAAKTARPVASFAFEVFSGAATSSSRRAVPEVQPMLSHIIDVTSSVPAVPIQPIRDLLILLPPSWPALSLESSRV